LIVCPRFVRGISGDLAAECGTSRPGPASNGIAARGSARRWGLVGGSGHRPGHCGPVAAGGHRARGALGWGRLEAVGSAWCQEPRISGGLPGRAVFSPDTAACQFRSVLRTYCATVSRAAGESHIRRTRSSVPRSCLMRSSTEPRIWRRVCASGSEASVNSVGMRLAGVGCCSHEVFPVLPTRRRVTWAPEKPSGGRSPAAAVADEVLAG
jgi:hypothetical protein